MKLLFVKFPFGTEMRMSQQNHEGGWSGIGMATVGIHPNDFDLYPNKIPPGRVVQNCLRTVYDHNRPLLGTRNAASRGRKIIYARKNLQ